jgi:hypothetical protein
METRDWSDIPRVGLPLVGLLSLVGLLWFWLAAVIGDGTDQAPTPTPKPPPTAEVVTAVPPSPTATAPVQTIVPTEGPEPTATPLPNPPVTLPPLNSPATETPADADARLTNATVNMRADATTESAIVEELPPGTEVRIVGAMIPAGPGEEFGWWPVINDASGKSGFIREDLLDSPA